MVGKQPKEKLVKNIHYPDGVYLDVRITQPMGMIALVVVSEGGEAPLNDVSGAKVKGKSKKKLKELLKELNAE